MQKSRIKPKKINLGNIAIICIFIVFLIVIIVNIKTFATEEKTSNVESSVNVTYVKSSDGYDIPVPEGFTASQVDGEKSRDGGFVIYEGEIDWDTILSTQDEKDILNLQTQVNQYVWVPVEDPSRIYGVDSSGKLWGKLYSSWSETDATSRTKLNWSETTSGTLSLSSSTRYREPGITPEYEIDSHLNSYLDGNTEYELLSEELEQSFYNVIQSIEKYGGFYIGRYETGGLSSENSNTAVVRKMENSINNANWYAMYEQCKSLGNENDNVETSMIWGCLFDETLQWFLDSRAKNSEGTTLTAEMISSDSATIGNYYNNSITYYTSDSATAGTWETESTVESSNLQIPTGSSDCTKINNIYDMAGNVWDMTMEVGSLNGKVIRGGYCGYNSSDTPLGLRNGAYPITGAFYMGCRSILYIKL